MNSFCPVAGRGIFVHCMRVRWPSLWRALHRDIWQAGRFADMRGWAARQGLGIRDEWLLQALAQTLAYWSTFPDTPDAQLDPEAKWYYYEPAAPELPDFQPVLQSPYPTYRGDPSEARRRFQAARTRAEFVKLYQDLEIETPEQFERRMKQQFNQQLKAYLRMVRAAYVYESKPEMRTHAHWAALTLAGMPMAQISRQPEWRRRFGRGDPESTIAKGVKRFAQYVGLTLPKGLSTLGDSLGTNGQKRAQNGAK